MTFPEGYTEVEHLPDALCLRSPGSGSDIWRELGVKAEKDAGGRLVVTVKQVQPTRAESVLQPECFALLKDYSRLATSRANRTIVVTKPKK